MLGYVTIEKAELKMWEYEAYNGYYCGVCKSIGSRYGQLPRMALSYDAAFLALLLAGLNKDEDIPAREHCLPHPVKKKTILRNPAIDYAADVMLILAWYKMLDDIHDEGKAVARATVVFMKGVYRELEEKQPVLCRKVKENLEQMAALEAAKCDSLDQVGEAFAKIMEAIFEEGPLPEGFKERQVLARIGYHLGKWLYLIDAVDDLEADLESGAYNPLRYRFRYREGEEGFKKRIIGTCRVNLLHYLGEIGKAVDLLAIKKNRGIIENIVYMGLLRKTESIAQEEET